MKKPEEALPHNEFVSSQCLSAEDARQTDGEPGEQAHLASPPCRDDVRHHLDPHAPGASPQGPETCTTCSDQALPARVLSVNRERGLALVEIEQQTAEVDVTLIEDVEPDDVLLVHGGVALSLWL